MVSMIYQSLFPPLVAAVEMREPGDPAALLPAESAYLGRSVPARVREFAAGRMCARRALAKFGIEEFPLRVGDDRQPIWPASMVGSITHTAGLCVAAVAPRAQLIGIGIDSEVIESPRAQFASRICVPAEFEWVQSLPAGEQAAATMLIFSAKEAFYKCQYPLVGEWLNFQDVYVEAVAWRPPAGAAESPADFTVQPTRPIAAAHLTPMPALGRYKFHEHFVSAAVAWAAPGAAAQ